MADYDRDGFLDLYLCVYSYFFGAGEDKAGTPMPYHDARNGPPGVLFRNDGTGRFVDATKARRASTPATIATTSRRPGPTTTRTAGPTCSSPTTSAPRTCTATSARAAARCRFEDVAAQAGVLDHGAGMSAAFLDYDNDGRLDIYTGNMWSAPGLRVTASPAFMPDAPPEVRALYRRHARGNSLFRNLRRRPLRGHDARGAAPTMGRWAWSSDALDFDSDGWDDLYVVNGMLTRDGDPTTSRGSSGGRSWRGRRSRRVKGTPYDDAWRAINQLLIHGSIASRQRNVFLRNDGTGGFDEVSGAVGLDLDQDGRSFAVLDVDRDGDPDLAVMAARQAPQLRVFRNDFRRRAARRSRCG